MSRISKILAAVTFLTVIPVKDERAHTSEALSRSAPYFPFAGFIIGLASAAAYTVALIGLGHRAASVIALFAMVLLTRGFHLFGYVRSLETFSGQKGIGTFGAAALFFLLALKLELLVLSLTGFAVHYLVALPIISRAALLPVINAVPPVSDDDIASKVSISYNKMLWSSTIALVVVFLMAGPQGVGALLIGFFAASAIGRYSKIRLGGITGDAYGFLVEVVELVVLAVLAL